MSKEDLLCFSKVKKGDFVAYEFIFNKYFKDLYRFGYSYLRDETQAEEIAQEVFLYLWDKREKIEIQTTLKTYLFSAVKNKCMNYIKIELPRQKNMSDVEQAKMFVSYDKDTTDNSELLKKQIKQAIDELPTKCKQVFMLSRYSGFTYEEIAEELGISKKTVENQMGIALKKLRISLEQTYEKFKQDFF